MPKNPFGERKIDVGSATALADEMASYVQEAGAGRPGDSIALMIRNASRALQMEHGRIKRLWYRNAAVITALEADHLRAWHRTHLARRADRLNAELAILQARLANLNDGDAA